MIRKLLRILYNRYPQLYSEVLASEFLRETPKSVSKPAISLLAEQKNVITKWLNYEGYKITRKSIGDMKHSDFYLGVVTNIKVFIKILEEETISGEYHKELGKVQTIPEYKKELKEHLAGVKKFKKGGAVDKE